MEATNLELTEQRLTEELVKWQGEFGNGRNNQDLRFGQYIWCKYDMSKVFSTPNSGTDGFATENPLIAFNQIHSKL